MPRLFNAQTEFAANPMGVPPGQSTLSLPRASFFSTIVGLDMKSDSKTLPFTLAFARHKCALSIATFTLTGTNRIPSRNWQPIKSARPVAQPEEPLSIYAVDDHPLLTRLYAACLEAIGYVVQTFNLRTNALAALKSANKKPALLITDYRGYSMSANQFIYACRSIHPNLRILMASGLHEQEMHFCRIRPDHFVQKPFTIEELQQTVTAILSPNT